MVCPNRKPDSALEAHQYVLSDCVPPGWYMVEISLDSPQVRTSAAIYLRAGNAAPNSIARLAMQIYTGRINKRLILVSSAQTFSLQLQSSVAEIKTFRLARVTRAFARSRLQRKLLALHPVYRKTHQSRGAEASSARSLETMWADYCKLFDETVEIAPYPDWVRTFGKVSPAYITEVWRRLHASRLPLISILMPVFDPDPEWLEQAIRSVSEQTYATWELCIANDASSNPVISSVLDHHAQADPRIRVVHRRENGHISRASNSALEIARGDWIALLDHDDMLAPEALLLLADVIVSKVGCRMVYSDEDKIDEKGLHSGPYFKCDWNVDLFLSQNMFSHLGAFEAALVHEVGGFRAGFEGSQDYDLALRCSERLSEDSIVHIPHVLYHWRIHAQSTAHSMDAKPYAICAGEKALNDHLQRTKVAAKAEATAHGYRIRYQLPEIEPLVSIIIPTRNGLKLLRQCIDSILLKTTYANFEILVVDNGSDEPKTLRYLESLVYDRRFCIIRENRPFNYSALNNLAARQANGSVLALLNNDVEVITPDWLTEMVSHALRPCVGAVGARLWYADDTLQHAGVVLGLEGFAGHVHRYLPKDNVGYCGRAALIQTFSAVTGACLVVRKATYELVGGLNETNLPVTCNDIDFCLKVKAAGFRNVWTPYAELYHHESSTRGFDDTPEKLQRAEMEAAYMWEHWGDLLRNDPAYSPNLSLDFTDFSLGWPPRTPFALLSGSSQHPDFQARKDRLR